MGVSENTKLLKYNGFTGFIFIIVELQCPSKPKKV
jgi:hypothetical protein